MADKPILFSGPMVRALLAGAQTQTRRILPNQTGLESVERTETGGWRFAYVRGYLPDRDGGPAARPPRVEEGDRLYVREHWRTGGAYDHLAPRDLPPEWARPIEYLADQTDIRTGRLRQGMHMPRWASRFTLTVTDVRVERLQNISPDDAAEEGAKCDMSQRTFIDHYKNIWEAINGSGSWEANPWVAAYTFTVERGNIDTLARAA